METLLANSVLAVAFLIGVGGTSTAIAFAMLGGKFIEGVARQPEAAPVLQVKMFIVAGLIDAIPIIGVAVALLITFANPFIGELEKIVS